MVNMKQNKSVAIITNQLSQYRVPCFSKLSEKMPGVFTFYFLTQQMKHRSIIISSKYHMVNAQWLQGWKWHSPPKDDRHLNNIIPVIKNHHDVIVLGCWDEPTYFLLWLWGIISKKRIIFWVESTLTDYKRHPFKEFYKRLLVRNSFACIVPGKRSFEYCQALGMAPERIFYAPNATDRDFFRSQAENLRPKREELRKEFGLSAVTILFVGRFVDEYKNISLLIKTFEQLKSGNNKAQLVLVGDGPDRARYEEMIQSGNISGVSFLGEMSQEKLCRVYAAADIMVLPSRSETWGFVLNEAMEFELPLLVTDVVGSGPDLVHIGENGFIVPSGDEEALCQGLKRLIDDRALRLKMGAESRRIVEHFSPENWASGVVTAIETILGDGR